MKHNKILNFLYSTRLMSVVVLLFAFAMAVATFIENDYGTPTAKALIYNTKWFEVLMLLLTINFIGNIYKYRLYRREKWPVFLFHIAFIITIFGSFVSRYFSFEGMMSIREGKVSSTIYSDRTYVMTRVDNNEIMKTFGENSPVMFSRIGGNSYHLNEEFGKDKNKTPFSVDLLDYVYKAKEELLPDPEGNSYIHIVESSRGNRNDIFLKEGEVKSIRNILFTYNKPIKGGMNFTVVNNQQFIQSPFDGNYMEMQTRELSQVSKDSLMPLQIKKLYSFDQLRFVVKEIVKGKLVLKTAPKKEQSLYPYDALKLKIQSGNEQKILVVRGTGGAVSQPEKVSLNGLNFLVSYGSKEIQLPFSIKLRDFELERYPGTNSASSYASEVTVMDTDKIFDYRIYMNHVLDYKGYRFFQSSYDKDEKGTVLSVNHDYWGTLITYIGYFLMGIGMFFTLFWKGTRFSDLNNKLKKITSKKTALLFLFLSVNTLIFSQAHDTEGLSPEELQKVSVSKTHADKFAHLVIQDHGGRLKPVNTYALESLRKIYKKDNYKGLTAEQILLSAQLNPEIWSAEPIIMSHTERFGKGSEIVKDLGFKDEHTNMIRFFTTGRYYLQDLVAQSFRKKKSQRTAKDKEIIDLDERANIWYSLLNGSLMHMYPKKGDPNNKWYAGTDRTAFVGQDSMILKMHQLYMQSLIDAIKTGDYSKPDEYLGYISEYQKSIGASVMPTKKKIDLEIKYNRYNVFFKLLIFYFNIGLILLILTFIHLFKPDKKWVANIINVFIGITILGLIIHTIGLGVRWYVSGHEPWSNSYEATVFIAWVIIIAGLIFTKNRTKFIITGAVLFSGFLLGIAHGNLMSPEMTNLVPVLKSYWLMIHVAVITASYGFLGLGSLLGFFVLLLFLIRTDKNKQRLTDTIKELSYINEMTLTIGLFLLSIGTFLGGVWANESWGRYWSWDPKEVWALISMMVYVFILHMRLVPGLRGKFAFNFASMISIATLIMTYFGVNYYLSGMHSYGKGDPIPIPDWIYYFIGFIVVFSIASFIRYNRIEKKR